MFCSVPARVWLDPMPALVEKKVISPTAKVVISTGSLKLRAISPVVGS